MRVTVRTALAALAALGPALTGCASTPAASGSTTANGTTLTVFAAASMKPTFTTLGTTFEATHPGVTVTFNFAGSQTLAEQIVNGAGADVFASANEANMKTVTDAGLATTGAKVYATNQLAIAVPPDNPAGITSWTDLTKKGLKLVVCAPAVPCGAATRKIEQATGTTLTPVSEEQAVSDVLAKVQAGEADAGLVYRTDVLAAGTTVKGIEFAESSKAINTNVIAALTNGSQAKLGQDFVDLVLSAEGRKVLKAAGFGAAD